MSPVVTLHFWCSRELRQGGKQSCTERWCRSCCLRVADSFARLNAALPMDVHLREDGQGELRY